MNKSERVYKYSKTQFKINSLSQVAEDYSFMADLFEVLAAHNVIPEMFLRSIQIKRDYRQLVASGIKGKEALEIIADQQFISTKAVEAVIYKKIGS